MWGKVLAHHENAAYPGWAELFSKGCPIQAYIPMVVFTEFCQYKQFLASAKHRLLSYPKWLPIKKATLVLSYYLFFILLHL